MHLLVCNERPSFRQKHMIKFGNALFIYFPASLQLPLCAHAQGDHTFAAKAVDCAITFRPTFESGGATIYDTYMRVDVNVLACTAQHPCAGSENTYEPGRPTSPPVSPTAIHATTRAEPREPALDRPEAWGAGDVGGDFTIDGSRGCLRPSEPSGGRSIAPRGHASSVNGNSGGDSELARDSDDERRGGALPDSPFRRSVRGRRRASL
jgi:hypothetical protein